MYFVLFVRILALMRSHLSLQTCLSFIYLSRSSFNLFSITSISYISFFICMKSFFFSSRFFWHSSLTFWQAYESRRSLLPASSFFWTSCYSLSLAWLSLSISSSALAISWSSLRRLLDEFWTVCLFLLRVVSVCCKSMITLSSYSLRLRYSGPPTSII